MSQKNLHLTATEYRQKRIDAIKKAERKGQFSTGQFALAANVAPRTISKWFDAGRIPGDRVFGSQDRRIPFSKGIAFLQENMPSVLDGLPIPGRPSIKVIYVGWEPDTPVGDNWDSTGEWLFAGQIATPGECLLVVDHDVCGVSEDIAGDFHVIATHSDGNEPPNGPRGVLEKFRKPFDEDLLAVRIEHHLREISWEGSGE